MIDVALLREQPDLVKKAVASKNADPALVDAFLKLDGQWRALTKKLDEARAAQKAAGNAKNIDEAKRLKDVIKTDEAQMADIEKERDAVWAQIPNLPSDDTPVGKSEEDNKVLRKWGEPRGFSFTPRDHLTIGERLGIIDTQKASEIAGTRFAYLKGGAAMLEFALIQHVARLLTDEAELQKIIETTGAENGIADGYSTKPFVPVVPPVMIRPDVFHKMARLEPKEERYYIPTDDAYLIGSAEHTLGPLHMGEILGEIDLPLRYLGFSTSFRREAGSYGKDTKGIIRVHQFDKLEMESLSTPEMGLSEQNFFVAIQEYLVRQLNIPYQIVMCCTGDQGDPDARHLDIEMWMPGQGKYRETHSADYMADYQSRRLETRVRRADNSLQFVHMNDATAIAIGRTLVAIIENYQTEDGKVEVPTVLQNYLGASMIE